MAEYNAEENYDATGTTEGGGDEAFKFDTDFDAEGEYKIPPIIPSAKYRANVTGVRFDKEKMALVWDLVIIADDFVVMSDGETPVNGVTIQNFNWFPKAGDENEKTKSGKMSKRQAKINMISDFQKKMRINMNSPKAIVDAVQNAEWIGIPVIIDVAARVYEGRISNQISSMVAE